MKQESKKAIVLQQLSRENTPMSLADLLQKLPEGYAERSVRRWLQELIQDGLVEKTGRKRGSQYAVTHTSQSQTHLISCFSLQSTHVIEQIRQPVYSRTPTTYNHKWLESYEPNHSFYFPQQVREKLYQVGKRGHHQEPAGTYAHQIFHRLLVDLSYNSSRLEGNTYSMLETERLLLQGISAEGKLDEEKVMIINHKEAIRYLVDHAAQLRMNVQTICTLHYLLSDGLLESQYSGKVRDHSVRVGRSTYLPLAQHRKLEEYLAKVAAKATLIEDPFERSLFALVHLSYLQAFADVNKRTARLAANISLISNNFVPISFNDIEKEDYTSAMIAVYELQDVRPIVDVYVYSYLRTCHAYDVTMKAFGFDEIRVRYRQERRRLLGQIIEKQLVDSQMLAFMQLEIKHLIPKENQELFLEDLLEDLEQMDVSRLAGLGITPEQLNTWLKLYRHS